MGFDCDVLKICKFIWFARNLKFMKIWSFVWIIKFFFIISLIVCFEITSFCEL